MDWGLYIHIPFCRRKCFYCDFVSYADKATLMPRYVEAVIAEMQNKRRALAIEQPPTTVYIGGGTPTALPLYLSEKLLTAIKEIFFAEKLTEVSPEFPEFTMEANPGTIDGEYLNAIRRYGVNRLSIGAQTFDEGLLKKLGRIHSPTDIATAVDLAKRAGFSNVSVDIMYGLPTQTVAQLHHDIEAAARLNVPHISVYGLTVEDGTPLAKMVGDVRLTLPDEKTVDEMYDYLTNELPRNGFDRYEISNYAKAGYESKHNLGYWHYRPYLGIGAAAHSFWRDNGSPIGLRFFNPSDIEKYCAAATMPNFGGQSESERDLATAMSEFCFLALRSATGIDRKRFAELFGVPLAKVYGATVQKLIHRGALIEQDGCLKLTTTGMKYGNMVFSEFV